MELAQTPCPFMTRSSTLRDPLTHEEQILNPAESGHLNLAGKRTSENGFDIGLTAI